MRDLTEQEKAHAHALEPTALGILAGGQAEALINDLYGARKEAEALRAENARLREELAAAQARPLKQVIGTYGGKMWDEIMEELQAERQAEGEWVSVEERLPPCAGIYLFAVEYIVDKGRDMEMLFYDGNNLPTCGEEARLRCTHWRDLPPLPGTQEEGA